MQTEFKFNFLKTMGKALLDIFYQLLHNLQMENTNRNHNTVGTAKSYVCLTI